jgi:ABC-type xylose transport system permease subunit
VVTEAVLVAFRVCILGGLRGFATACRPQYFVVCLKTLGSMVHFKGFVVQLLGSVVVSPPTKIFFHV